MSGGTGRSPRGTEQLQYRCSESRDAVTEAPRFIDIHCHLLPGLDDGAHSWEDAIEMAHRARADGIRTIIATPHQLGSYTHIRAEVIRARTAELQEILQRRGIFITVLPGADVRVEEDLVRQLVRGDVLTLADQRRHVLLELPPHRYVPLDDLIEQSASGRHRHRAGSSRAKPRPFEAAENHFIVGSQRLFDANYRQQLVGHLRSNCPARKRMDVAAAIGSFCGDRRTRREEPPASSTSRV